MKFTSQLRWGIVSQCCNIFIPFLIIFYSYKYIEIELASIWVIFLSMVSLVLLFDFGLSPAIVRNVSYVISGAKNLVKTVAKITNYQGELEFGAIPTRQNELMYSCASLERMNELGWKCEYSLNSAIQYTLDKSY